MRFGSRARVSAVLVATAALVLAFAPVGVATTGGHSHAHDAPRQDKPDQDDNGDGGRDTNGFDVLALDCSESELPPHDGFENAPACSEAVFGEISDAADNPQLLFVEFPTEITSGDGFTLQVSSRNLVRDRFLAAGEGGYYLESSVLDENGLQRGHFHVSCRPLGDAAAAPDPNTAPGFFAAVEDGGGGAEADTVTIEVPGATDGEPTFAPGEQVQCAAWAGDGSHRLPMMERANQVPAFDAVRIAVE